MHIHAAERTEEVAEVAAGLGARPIEWLLDHTRIDERWYVIHATHMTEPSAQRSRDSGAVAGLCPLTEANLADGLFRLAPYRHDGGRLGIGTDANHLIDLPGELRMLEYGQRIVGHRRDSLLGGRVERRRGAFPARGERRRPGTDPADRRRPRRPSLRPGRTRPDHPAFAGQSPSTILDAWIFSTASDSLVRTVIIAGQPVIEDGHHPLEAEARERVDARHAANDTACGDAHP